MKKDIEDPAQKLYRKQGKELGLGREVDNVAMWAFFFSIALPLSIVFWPVIIVTVFFPPIGLILSVISIVRINNDKKLKGYGFAISSLVLSVIEMSLIMFLFFIGFSIFSIFNAML